MNIKTFFDLLRVHQWYKNLVIYLALIFSNLLFHSNLFLLTTLGLVALCFVSSSNYIINDIIDLKKDRAHPEKKFRPIASGKIEVSFAIIISVVLLLAGLLIAYKLSLIFFISSIFLFVLTFSYTLYLKNILFLDVIIISVNFVIRAVSGTFIINRILSPWLILCPFFLALFLAVGKRHGDFKLLGKNAVNHKQVLKDYTPEINSVLIIISTTLLLISYSLYAFLGEHKKLLLTIPFAIYVVFRYLYLIYSGSIIARKPNLLYRDKELVVGLILLLLAVIVALYLDLNTYQIIYPIQSS
ncbi:UbiA prenyltransferase family protein [Candidatus Woesearchaeota archaeon]|nr:UbiA prenyltransferase family protein [Candidatus Woesearchaeota archaeon]